MAGVMSIVSCPRCGAKNRLDERALRMQPVCGKCGAKLEPGGEGEDYDMGGGGKPIDVTDASLPTVLAQAGDRPVLIDCWAAWCGPCRMIAPAIDQLAAQSNNRYVVAKLDIDTNQRTAAQFRIDSIPALLIFKRGQLVDKLVGLQPADAIARRLMAHA